MLIRNRFIFQLASAVLLCFCGQVWAASQAMVATLHEAVELAWQRHPELIALASRDEAANAGKELADRLTADAGAISLSSRNDQLNRHPGLQEHEVEISTALWLPGQRSARQSEALAKQDELAAQRMALRWEIAGQVSELWWQVAAARQGKILAERRFEEAQALARDMQARFRSGEASRIDANLAQAEVHQAQMGVLDELTQVRQAEQAFQLLTGAEIVGREIFPQNPTSTNGQLNADEKLDLDSVVSSHPLLLQANRQLDSARARAKLTQASQRAAPELALRAVRERATLNEAFTNSIGIRLKIPFASPAQNRQDNANARAETIQSELDVMRISAALRIQIEQAVQLKNSTQQQIELAQQNVLLANDNLQLVEKAFRLGEQDLVTLLRAKAAAFQAQSVLNKQKLAEASAVSKLHQAMGRLP